MLIRELTLLTSDLFGTETFYNRTLGFTLIKKTDALLSFQVGHSVLNFLESKEGNPFYHFAFSIPSNKINEAHSFIVARTNILPFDINGTIADFSNWNAHAFYFLDNEGNIVEFIAHHDLSNDIEESFEVSKIPGLCEIGVPVPDVEQACEKLNKDFKVPYFEKGPKFQDFSVMGDSNGLFIVTKVGRGWLPTQRPAENHFTSVVFENNDTTHQLDLK